jgi:hypothetical protein
MPYIAKNLNSYNERDMKVVGTGHCVPFVQEATGAPHSGNWNRGKQVKGNTTILKGTAIATFNAEGKYTNSLDGTSHAAVYIEQSSIGIHVWDQWLKQPVHMRWIRFQKGVPGVNPVNDGDAFYVVE